MSLDISLKSDEPTIKICKCSCCDHEHETTIYETYCELNITHNLNKMAEVCGMYLYLWHPEKKSINLAKDLIKPLEKGLEKLKKERLFYRCFDHPSGYGSYDYFVAFVTKYLAACKTYPNAVINVSS